MASGGSQDVPSATYGFIGLGVMGFGMAQNLRRKIPKDSDLVVCEIVEDRRDRFIAETEMDGGIKVAHTPKEVAEQCVSLMKQYSSLSILTF